MIKVTSLISKKTTTFNHKEFISKFEQWQEIDKSVFKNRARKEKSFEFNLANYEFDNIDYCIFKAKYLRDTSVVMNHAGYNLDNVANSEERV